MEIFGFSSPRPPLRTDAARTLDEVVPLLSRAAQAAAAGRWAAVLVTYDAAPAFDPALQVYPGTAAPPPSPPLPFAFCAEFEHMHPAPPRTAAPPVEIPAFAPSLTEAEFGDRVRQVQRHILDGDTYQVNLTFPLHAGAPADPAAWFRALQAAQQAPYEAMLEIGDTLVLSLSPELFFEIEDGRIRTRPMKGTARRGRWLAEDEQVARGLAGSAKAQAENVMIVDLLRNDVGRVATTGSVSVPELFTTERYPTLWQLTSTVEGLLRDGVTLADVFMALFPCGSVTGAPKIRTMEIISRVEPAPRGLYTGTIGLLRPDGSATFNVAIRTIVIDRARRSATLGVGAGITADSDPAGEYAECLLKAAFATPRHAASAGRFELLETLRLEEGAIPRLDRHLRRAAASARYFGFDWDEAAVRASLDQAARDHRGGTWRLRLTVDARGVPAVACTPHPPADPRAWHVAFANAPVDSGDPFLCNKTTRREAYDTARRGRPDVDDVLLWNERGELTESTIANVVVDIGGARWTPPVTCGLLAGTLRAELIDGGAIRERVITRGEVMRAERVWLINSLRGWIDAVVVR